ncbi:MAG: hypothetical protein HQK56_20445 [Deltaproteobacteria bacterium]|nr:hypothetical protein [Deltaproteobacteria bacterium]
MQIKAGKVNAAEKDRRKILVIGQEDRFSHGLMDYAITLADRLGYDLLALSVGILGDERYSQSYQRYQNERFSLGAIESAAVFKQRARQKKIACEHEVKFGDAGRIVENIHHQIKRIEFVVTESKVIEETIASYANIPVFCINSNGQNRGGNIMANVETKSKKMLFAQTVGYGLLTVGLYAAVFSNAGVVMKLFTQGGWSAALPIATVFVFSFAHGAFASNLWSLLGISARKAEQPRVAERKVVQPRVSARKRPRVYAHINNYHNI